MHQHDNQPAGPPLYVFHLFAGVIMPAISITVEATTHICADFFFDPIPTFWHLALVVFVPLAQLQAWFAIRRNDPARLRLASVMNTVVLGISIFYSIVYLPVVPLGLLTLLVAVGLLPLVPYLSLIAALLMRRRLKQIAATAPEKPFGLKLAGLLAGLALTTVLIGLIELPATLTRYGLQMATSSSPQTRSDGIRFLRNYGSQEYLLRSCYEQSGRATDLLGEVFSIRSPVSPADAQKIYYRVTGETFDASAPPKRVGSRVIPQDEFEFDNHIGETRIAGKVKGLSLDKSKIEGSLDADGGVGYLEWTLVFTNASVLQREARAEVQLPPGGVVSRLTLWVDGEEREAAFAGRGQVQQAYRQVVQTRRDPVLVTTAGRDRILVQCFPVPAFNGEMKIRFGISVPLLLEHKEQARLLLPHFVNRNFNVPDRLKHQVFLSATRPLNNDYGSVEYPQPSNGKFELWGEFSDSDLLRPETSIRLARWGNDHGIWATNPFEVDKSVVRQSIEQRYPIHLRRIVLVVDTSASMAQWKSTINQALETLPREFDIKLVLADADQLLESERKYYFGNGLDHVTLMLASTTFTGGADNVPALGRAWDLAAETPGNNAVVWIHSPQLVQLESAEILKRRWARGPYGPTLYSIKTSVGPDEVERQLDGINEVKSVPRLGRLRTDLERLFRQLSGQVPTLTFVRSVKHPKTYPDSFEGMETTNHLARLWANDEVTRILGARDAALNEAAITLAVRYQLVTPVSGAVVLETAEQYRAAGLKPVDAGTVPTIPEPETLSMLVIAGLFLSWLFYRRYRKAGGVTCP